MPKFSGTFGSDFFVQGNQGAAHLEQEVLRLQHFQCFITCLEKGMGENPV